jgi:hypothetical protein
MSKGNRSALLPAAIPTGISKRRSHSRNLERRVVIQIGFPLIERRYDLRIVGDDQEPGDTDTEPRIQVVGVECKGLTVEVVCFAEVDVRGMSGRRVDLFEELVLEFLICLYDECCGTTPAHLAAIARLLH